MTTRARGDKSGEPFYGPYDAQELVSEHSEEVGIGLVKFEEIVYNQSKGEYMARSEVAEDETIASLSGTEFRRRLKEGSDIPAWFSYPEIIEELRNRFPSRARQGFTLFLTGLSGSGKSTIANILMAKLMEIGTRPVTLLDGDIVRKNLSSELTFSKEHRDLNIQRIGFVASEITKNRGVAICAPIAPYRAVRREVRELIDPLGGFVEVFVSTPLRGVREARSQGALRQGQGRHHQRLHGNRRPLRGAGERRDRARHRQSQPRGVRRSGPALPRERGLHRARGLTQAR